MLSCFSNCFIWPSCSTHSIIHSLLLHHSSLSLWLFFVSMGQGSFYFNFFSSWLKIQYTQPDASQNSVADLNYRRVCSIDAVKCTVHRCFTKKSISSRKHAYEILYICILGKGIDIYIYIWPFLILFLMYLRIQENKYRKHVALNCLFESLLILSCWTLNYKASCLYSDASLSLQAWLFGPLIKTYVHNF